MAKRITVYLAAAALSLIFLKPSYGGETVDAATTATAASSEPDLPESELVTTTVPQDPEKEKVHALLDDACKPDPHVHKDIWKPGDLNKLFERVIEDYKDTVTILSRPPKGPWIIMLEDFLTPSECNGMMQATKLAMQDSEYSGGVTNNEPGACQFTQAWCSPECLELPALKNVTAKLSHKLVDIEWKHAEELHFIEYVPSGQQPGQQQRQQPCSIGTDADELEKYGLEGPRLMTILMYLNDMEGEGGQTCFPLVDDDDNNKLCVEPKKGRALMWPNVLNENPSLLENRTWYEAHGISKGTKYASTVWFHLRDFQYAESINCLMRNYDSFDDFEQSRSIEAKVYSMMNEECIPDPEIHKNIWKPGDSNKLCERVIEEYKDKVTVLSRPPKGPWVITVDDFLTHSECDGMIEATKDALKDNQYSGLANDEDGEGNVYACKSTQAWCSPECLERPALQNVTAKSSKLVDIEWKYAEALHFIQYVPGQHYGRHSDAIETEMYSLEGPRLMTILLYLNDMEGEGGQTCFPDIDNNLCIEPKKGRALMWPNVLDEDPTILDNRTWHEAYEISQGYKYASTIWFHLRDYEYSSSLGCLMGEYNSVDQFLNSYGSGGDYNDDYVGDDDAFNDFDKDFDQDDVKDEL